MMLAFMKSLRYTKAKHFENSTVNVYAPALGCVSVAEGLFHKLWLLFVSVN